MLGAFTYGWFAGENAANYALEKAYSALDNAQISAEQKRVYAPFKRTHGLSPYEVEYKLRRLVNDYLQPPKVTKRMQLALQRFAEIAQDVQQIHAHNPHELMRAQEVSVILDCAQMAAQASLFREESRWGLYHHRVDFPERNDADWFCHTLLAKDENGLMRCFKKPIEPYLFPLDKHERNTYQQLRKLKQTPKMELNA